MKRMRLPAMAIWLPATIGLAFAAPVLVSLLASHWPLWLVSLGGAVALMLTLHYTLARPAGQVLRAAHRFAFGGAPDLARMGGVRGGVRELSELAATLERICRRAQASLDDARLAASAFEASEGIVIVDGRGRVLRVNHAYCRMTGFDAGEMSGRSVVRLLARGGHTGVRARQIAWMLQRHGNWEGEVWQRRRHGQEGPVWLSISAIRDPGSAPIRYVGICLDLTEIHAEREKARRAASDEHIIGEILRLAIQPHDSIVFLQRALETLLASPDWLAQRPGGAIFAVEPEGQEESLRLLANHALSPEQIGRYACIPLDDDSQGSAALSRATLYAAGDLRQAMRRCQSEPLRGHFALPIQAGHQMLGVLALSLPDEYPLSLREQAFLRRVADALGVGMAMHKTRAEVAYHDRHDALTGLPNRNLLLERLQQEMAMARRRNAYGGLLFIDLDNFKTFNDALGHGSGDALLGQIADRLRQRVRTGDTVVRHGGDEFLVVLPDLGTDKTHAGVEARQVADKLRAAITEPIYLDGRQLHVSPSMGITLFPHNGDTPETVMQHAEVAMYRAKQAGRDTIRFYAPDMQAAAESHLQLQNDLRHALDADELTLHYQPQIDGLGRLRGVEALLRWHHARRGMIAPSEFIPIAEESGLILRIGYRVLREACRQLVDWQRAGVRIGSVAVNVSARQFHQADFVARVERILEETGANPHQLELELTESLLIDNLTEAVDKMQALRRRGVRFAIDDFGTGYSSLAYLKKLPLDRLKIDQSFVREMTADSRDAAIIRAVLSIAGHLGLEVVAEGVETETQRLTLLEMGCALFQGYHLGHPSPAEALPLHLSP